MKTHFTRQLTGSFVLANIAPCVRDKEKTAIDLYLEAFCKEFLQESRAHSIDVGIQPRAVCADLPGQHSPEQELLVQRGTPSSDTGCPKNGPGRDRNTALRALWMPLRSRTHPGSEETMGYPCDSLPAPGGVTLLTPQPRTEGQGGEKNLGSVQAQNDFCLYLSSTTQTILH